MSRRGRAWQGGHAPSCPGVAGRSRRGGLCLGASSQGPAVAVWDVEASRVTAGSGQPVAVRLGWVWFGTSWRGSRGLVRQAQTRQAEPVVSKLCPGRASPGAAGLSRPALAGRDPVWSGWVVCCGASRYGRAVLAGRC